MKLLNLSIMAQLLLAMILIAGCGDSGSSRPKTTEINDSMPSDDQDLVSSCDGAESQDCLCADGETALQCASEEGGWDACQCTTSYSYWNDPATTLSWQNPQKDAYLPGYEGLGQPDSKRYCDELVLHGYDDWRLPDIDELRTLIRGNPNQETGGACPMTHGAVIDAMKDPACVQAPDYEGPAEGGCYWADGLEGPCDRDDVADEGERAMETVSSTQAADDLFWKADVLFDQATAVFNHRFSLAEVRCVRDGPSADNMCIDGPAEACQANATRSCEIGTRSGVQTCAPEGSCWSVCDDSSFEPTPPLPDISAQCDQVELTINLPEPMLNPEYLVVFMYKAENWNWLPKQPPDGGTDTNQVINPDISFGSPYHMTLPAVSYYRDRCVEPGDYNIFVTLLQSSEWPPWPTRTGDFSWGEGQASLTMTQEQNGTPIVHNLEVTLEKWEE